MSSRASSLAQRASRWWRAPVRFTAETIALLRRPALRREDGHGRWLTQTPVGIRAPLDAQS